MCVSVPPSGFKFVAASLLHVHLSSHTYRMIGSWPMLNARESHAHMVLPLHEPHSNLIRTLKSPFLPQMTTTNWTALVDIVTEGGESGAYAYTSEVRYAQCWTATCTLNGDGLTASCGCLSLPPSDEYPAKLKFGWSSSIMAKSGAYQKAIASAAAGDDFDTYNEIIVDAIKDGSIYSAYGFDTPPDLISMNSKVRVLHLKPSYSYESITNWFSI